MRFPYAVSVALLALSVVGATTAFADPQRRTPSPPLGRLRVPALQRATRVLAPILSEGAKLDFDIGDVVATYTIKYVAPPSLAPTPLKWDVTRVPGAGAVVFRCHGRRSVWTVPPTSPPLAC